jgi:uncharacterized protein YndB with AHSA1/START domain
MKVLGVLLLGIVGLVALAVLVFVVLGRRPGAGRTSSSIEIAAPADTVFAWISRPERVKQWVSWLVEVRQDHVTPDGVGSRETWVMNDPNMKQQVEVKSEVLRYEPPHRVDVKVSMDGGFEGAYTYTLEPTAAGTRVTLAGSSRYHAWIARLLEPLVTPQAQKKQEDDFLALKRLVESSPR